MADETRITQAIVQAEIAQDDLPVRITQAVLQAEIAEGDLPVRLTQAVLQVEVHQPYPSEAFMYGPRVQVMA